MSVVAKAVAAVVIGVIVGGGDGNEAVSSFVAVDEGSGAEGVWISVDEVEETDEEAEGAREGNDVETVDVETDGIDDVLVDKTEEVVSNKVEEVVSVEVCQGRSDEVKEVVSGGGDEVRSDEIEEVISGGGNEVRSDEIEEVVSDKVEEIVSDEIDEGSVDIDHDGVVTDGTNDGISGKGPAIVAAVNKHASKKAVNIAQEVSGTASERSTYSQYI